MATVSIDKFCTVVGATRNEITDLVKQGVIERTGQQFDLSKSIRQYIDALRSSADVRALNEQLLREKVEKTREEKEKLALQNANSREGEEGGFSRAALGRVLGIRADQVSHAIGNGILPAPAVARGRLDLVASVEAWLRHKTEQATKAGIAEGRRQARKESGERQKALAKKATLEAEALKLELAVRKGELLTADEASTGYRALVDHVRDCISRVELSGPTRARLLRELAQFEPK